MTAGAPLKALWCALLKRPGRVVMRDAMGCQGAFARQRVGKDCAAWCAGWGAPPPVRQKGCVAMTYRWRAHTNRENPARDGEQRHVKVWGMGALAGFDDMGAGGIDPAGSGPPSRE